MFKQNSKFEILTPSGFKPFLGINKKEVKTYVEVIFKNGLSLKCTPEHKLKTRTGFIEAKNSLDSFILTNREEIQVILVKPIEAIISVFDPVNVGEDKLYFSNNIVSHNCVFLGTGDTFVDDDALINIASGVMPPNYTELGDKYWKWALPEPHKEYMLTFDPAFGVKRDNSAFHIIDLYTGEQVAEFCSNQMKPEKFADVVYDAAGEYNNALVVGERNTLGQIVLDKLFERLEYQNMFFADDGELGIKIGGKNQRDEVLEALQDNLYNKKIKINSQRTVDELGTFIITETGKVEADEGCTDDLVISLGITGLVRNYLIENGSITPGFLNSKNDSPEDNIIAFITSKPSELDKHKEYLKWILS